MIYTNFILFIVAIIVFVMAPEEGGRMFPALFDVYGVLLIVLGFWNFNRHKFIKLRTRLESGDISVNEAKTLYMGTVNRHCVYALTAFIVEIFFCDLKVFFIGLPLVGGLNLFVNSAGLTMFILHLAMVWYWAYRSMGDVLNIGPSAGAHVRTNIKFNLPFLIPCLVLSLFFDLLNFFSTPDPTHFMNSPLFHLLFSAALFIGIYVFFPVLVIPLWDCKPLPDSELRESILAYCRSQGVKFKNIMSWDALNGGLVTAAVMGPLYPFRYLLITPELVKMLDRDELMGVVSHEVGHVKKKHLFFYLILWVGFVIFSSVVINRVLSFLFNTSLGWSLVIGADGTVNTGLVSGVMMAVSLIFFVLYLRFVFFGYFMRNFERQADLFCFESGVDPDALVASFMKLGIHLGDDGRKRNWHHYSIPQRIEFLRSCMDEPDRIRRHDRKVKRSVALFVVAAVFLAVLSFYPGGAFYGGRTDQQQFNRMAQALMKQIERNPGDPELHGLLGMVSYELQRWEQAREAYEESLRLNYDQADILNNLAWLLLTCPEKHLLNHSKALVLARHAASLNGAVHILDTLAEAYFQNAMYEDAYRVARRAYLNATENKEYYKEQMDKMGTQYKKYKNAVNI